MNNEKKSWTIITTPKHHLPSKFVIPSPRDHVAFGGDIEELSYGEIRIVVREKRNLIEVMLEVKTKMKEEHRNFTCF